MPAAAVALVATVPPGALLLWAVRADCRTRRIPNVLWAWGLLSAALTQALLPQGPHPLHPTAPGTPGLWPGVQALLLMLALTLLMWRVKLFGAGDAKLLTMLAAHGSPASVWPLLLSTALCGGVLSLVWWMARRRNPLPYSLAIAAAQALDWAAAREGARGWSGMTFQES